MPGHRDDAGARRAALEAMAQRIAEAVDEAWRRPAEARPRVLVFRVGARRWSLPLGRLREVTLPPARYARVPHSPGAVLGLTNVRGRVVAVVSLAGTLRGEGAVEPAAAARVLLLERGGGAVGLLVDEVVGIEPPHAAHPTLDLDAVLATARGDS